MLYKYAWTPVIKGTHSLITDLTFWELWLTWASQTLLQVTPPGFKLTCINRGETNWGDSGLHGKVTLVPNSSYLFSAGTISIKYITQCISQYVCIFSFFFKLIIHMWTILLYETKVHNISIFYFNNDICNMYGTKVHKTPDYYTIPQKSHPSYLFSNLVISIF